MDITSVDNAGKINLPLNIATRCGIKPGVLLQGPLEGNTIILTKIDHA
ncbi:MAG: hypothetical protein RBG13Loki_3684 [Promethearchaeota archaeon CR_4]|nr:MAG: hypothetical protein RBG13Loki_3684 [Candidatus Lokiarchaeota archaeon CR_4]